MSETTEYLVGGFAHWEDSDGTWWYRDAIGVSCVATLAMLPYLESLAAARREVETVNEEAERQAGVICNLNTDLATSRAALEDVRRDEARQALATVGIEQVEGEWCYTSDDGEQPADSLADALQRTLALIDRDLHADLATSRAALEDVRRVEAWIQAGNAPDLPEHSIAGLVNARYGAIVRWEDEETTVATGDSLEALGRALAQEAGDAMR